MSDIGAAHLAFWLLLVVSGYAVRQLRRGGLDLIMRLGLSVNLVGVMFVWLRANKPVEGTIFLVLAPGHGVTEADLLSALPVSLAIWALWGQLGDVSALLKRR